MQLYKDCEIALVTGQAKSYKIGSREFEALDLGEIRKTISYFAGIVEQLSGTARRRVVRVVPRDL